MSHILIRVEIDSEISTEGVGALAVELTSLIKRSMGKESRVLEAALLIDDEHPDPEPTAPEPNVEAVAAEPAQSDGHVWLPPVVAPAEAADVPAAA